MKELCIYVIQYIRYFIYRKYIHGDFTTVCINSLYVGSIYACSTLFYSSEEHQKGNAGTAKSVIPYKLQIFQADLSFTQGCHMSFTRKQWPLQLLGLG